MNTKKIPAVIMLIAAAIVSFASWYFHYDIKMTLKLLSVALILFCILGLVIKKIVDKFLVVEPVADITDDIAEGEVIEKETDHSEESSEQGMES